MSRDTPGKPVGDGPRRRRDAAATREAILAAATRRFASQGYERTGLREIAADVGVTAAMVNRYFKTKEALFAEVIERAFDVGHLLRGEWTDLAEHLARVVVYGRDAAGDEPYSALTPIRLLLHSATQPSAIELFRQDLDRTELRHLADRIGGEDATLRAAMIVAQLMGFAIMHGLLRPEAFSEAQGEKLVGLLSRSLAACIGGSTGGAGSPPPPLRPSGAPAPREGADGDAVVAPGSPGATSRRENHGRRKSAG